MAFAVPLLITCAIAGCGMCQVTGMLLSPRGMMVLNAPSDVKASTEMNEKTFADINPDMVRFRVCADCYRTLQRGTTPRNAIANGHFMGELPASVPPIRSYSRIERVIVSPIVRFARVVVLSGGGQRSLSGHSVSYRLDVSKVANTLPLSVADSKIRVIMSNAYANEQKIRALKPYAVRREFVASVLRFFRANNHLYNKIAIDPVAIA